MAWIPLLASLLLSSAPDGEGHNPYRSTASKDVAIAGTKKDFAREYFCWSRPVLDEYSARSDGLPVYGEPALALPDLDFASHNFALGKGEIQEQPQAPTSRSVFEEFIQVGAHPIDRIRSFGRELTTRLVDACSNTARRPREIDREIKRRSRNRLRNHSGPTIAMTPVERDSIDSPKPGARLTDIRWAIEHTVSEAIARPGPESVPVLIGRREQSNEDFFCGYPALLTFGFHVPARIDAGLRWCFDCGAWQPCDCPRSTATPELRSLIDGELAGNGFDSLQDYLAKLRMKLDALRDAREKMIHGARADSPSPIRDRIVSAFGILVPDSDGWPTVLRYFAKPLPGASLPNSGGDDLTIPAASGGSP